MDFGAMLQLFITHGQRLQRAGQLLMRHWVVAYPLLLLQLVLELLLTPALVQPLTLSLQGDVLQTSWRLLAVAVMALMLLSAFTAGWVGMMVTLVRPSALLEADDDSVAALAVKRHHAELRQRLEQKTTERPLLLETVVVRPPLWRGFFVAIGQYFVPFIAAWLVVVACLASLGWWVHTQTLASGGYPLIFKQVWLLMNHAAASVEPLSKTVLQTKLMALLQALPPSEAVQLDHFSSRVMAALGAALLLAVMTICWPAALVLGTSRPPFSLVDAFTTSLHRFFKAPVVWVLLGIATYFAWIMTTLLLALLPNISGLLGPVLGFAWLLAATWLGLYTVICTVDDAPKVVLPVPPHGDVFEATRGDEPQSSSGPSPSGPTSPAS